MRYILFVSLLCLVTSLVSSKPLTEAQINLLGQLINVLDDREMTENEEIFKKALLSMPEDRRSDKMIDNLQVIVFTLEGLPNSCFL